MTPASTDTPLPGFDAAPSVETRHSSNAPRLPVTAAARNAFWSHVVKGPGQACWIWIASISSNDGYGRTTWQVAARTRTISAHRLALMLAYGGELPDGVIAEHACNEPLCVRVGLEHVHMSTQAENLRYAVARGRHRGNRPVGWTTRDRVARSRAVRAALADGWDTDAYLEAARTIPGAEQLPLVWP